MKDLNNIFKVIWYAECRLLAEHFFTRPTDVVASSVSILLLLSPLHTTLKDMGAWYWIFWFYSCSVLAVSMLSLLLLDNSKSPSDKKNRISAILKAVAVRFGSGRFLWFSLFALSVLFYVDSQSPLFIVLFGYASVLLLIDPKKAIFSIKSLAGKTETEIAKLFGIQSSSAFLARMYPNSISVNRFDVVGFLSNSSGSELWMTGLVLETYELNEQRWLKILTDTSFQELEEKTIRPAKATNGVIHILPVDGALNLVKRLVGTVCEGATIEKLKFEYAFNVNIQEGELLEVLCNDNKVLYQVVEGTTGSETLESKDEAGFIIGEAVQLGIWDSDKRNFDRYGWVPRMNSPVSK